MFVLFKSTLSSQPLKTLFKTEIKGKIKSSKLEQINNNQISNQNHYIFNPILICGPINFFGYKTVPAFIYIYQSSKLHRKP